MVFQSECTRFLDTIINLRKNTIEREILKELELKHTPYRVEMEKVRDDVIAQETAEAQRQIRQIQEALTAKINTYREETAKAIEKNRETVVAEATARVSQEYDAFILGVSQLVDNTSIKD